MFRQTRLARYNYCQQINQEKDSIINENKTNKEETTPPPPLNIATKSFSRTMAEYGGFTGVSMGAYSFALIELVNHFTVLGPYYITPPVVCASIYGLVLGFVRGTVLGMGDSLVASRRLSSFVSQAIKEIGADEIRLDNASEEELTAFVEKLYTKFPWTYQKTIGASFKRTIAFAFLPNVEQVITGIHTEIQYNKLQT